MAVCAKSMNKPFYVLAESFKFVRLYPLNSRDLPKELKVIVCLFAYCVVFAHYLSNKNPFLKLIFHFHT